MPAKPSDVAEYIAAAPKAVRPRLRELRAAIRAAAPEAKESISYRMPYYSWHGRLAYFACFKNHVGLYVPTPVIQQHERELKKYVTAKATVQFPLEKPIPAALVRKLIRARVALNEMKRKDKK